MNKYFVLLAFFVAPLSAYAASPLYVGTVGGCNAGVISTNSTHMGCATQYIGDTLDQGNGPQLYVGVAPGCNAGVVSTNPNHLNCATQPIGQINSPSTPGQQALFLGIEQGCNAGVLTTNGSDPSLLNCATELAGYTAPVACHPWGTNLPSGQSVPYYNVNSETYNNSPAPSACTPAGTFVCNNGDLQNYVQGMTAIQTCNVCTNFIQQGSYSCEAYQGQFGVPAGYSRNINSNNTISFRLNSCTQVLVYESGCALPLTPTVTLSDFAPAIIAGGNASSIRLDYTNVTSCTVSGNKWNGDLGVSGTGSTGYVSTGPMTEGTYTESVTCLGAGGSATAGPKSLVVTPAPSPVAGACGDTMRLDKINTCDRGTLGANAAQSGGVYDWYCNGVNGGASSPLCQYIPPTCSGAGPTGNPNVAHSSGNTYSVSAYGVQNAANVKFATWTDANGQDDIRWYDGVKVANSGTWTASIDFNAYHSNSDGQYSVHVYMSEPSGIFCGTANFIRTAQAVGACGPGSGTTPQLSEPTGASACSSGAYANSPADTTTSGQQAWNWSCGSVNTCSAPKFGCTTATDTNYDATGPNNLYRCANTCANSSPSYPACSFTAPTVSWHGGSNLPSGITWSGSTLTVPSGVTIPIGADGYTATNATRCEMYDPIKAPNTKIGVNGNYTWPTSWDLDAALTPALMASRTDLGATGWQRRVVCFNATGQSAEATATVVVTAATAPSLSNVGVSVSSSSSGPFVPNGFVKRGSSLYVKTGGLVQSATPKGCAEPRGSGACTASVPPFRIFNQASDTWNGAGTEVTTYTSAQDLWPDGTYDGYAYYIGAQDKTRTGSFGVVGVYVSTSQNGPWVLNGSAPAGGPLFVKITGLDRARIPKGCSEPRGSGGCGPVSVGPYRLYNQSTDTWNSAGTEVIVDGTSGAFPAGTYDGYAYYEGSVSQSTGSFTITPAPGVPSCTLTLGTAQGGTTPINWTINSNPNGYIFDIDHLDSGVRIVSTNGSPTSGTVSVSPTVTTTYTGVMHPPGLQFSPAPPTYSCSVTVTIANNQPPAAPTISGPTTGLSSTSYGYTFTSTDPENNQLKYEIDWDNNGTTDQTMPASGYVSSGISQTQSNNWASGGVKTFKARAVDNAGAASGWTTYSVTITAAGTPSCSLTSTENPNGSSTLRWMVNSNPSGYEFTIDHGVGTVSSNCSPSTTTCTTSVSPTSVTTYTGTMHAAGSQFGASPTYSCSVTVTPPPSSSDPRITSLSPSCSTDASLFSIYGNNFSAFNQVHFITASGVETSYWVNVPSYDSNGDQTVWPDVGGTEIRLQPYGLPNGAYQVYVISQASGVSSNTALFTIPCAGSPSGTITPRTCDISVGQFSCVMNISWRSSGTIGEVTVRRPYASNSIYATGPNGDSAATFPFGTFTLDLYDGGAKLSSADFVARCGSGTSWNQAAGRCTSGGPGSCSNGANNPQACNRCTLPLVWNAALNRCNPPPPPPPPGACRDPWGGPVLNGNFVIAFRSLNPVYPATCVSERRTCRNGILDGTFTSRNCIPPNPPAPNITSFTATTPSGVTSQTVTIDKGQSAKLKWSSINTTACISAEFNTSGATSNSTGVSVSPLTDTTYNIACNNPANPNGAVDAVVVKVVQPGVNISATPSRVHLCNAAHPDQCISTVAWSAVDSSDCLIKGPGFATAGFSYNPGDPTTHKDIRIASQSTYTITCQTHGLPVVKQVIVNVVPDFTEF